MKKNDVRRPGIPAIALALVFAGSAGASLGCGAPDEPAEQTVAVTAAGALRAAPSAGVSAPLASSAPLGAVRSSAAAAPTIPTYQGGAIMSPEIVTLYWGTFTAADQSSMQTYISGLANYISGPNSPFGQEPTVKSYGVYGATVGATYRDTTLPSRGGKAGHAIQADA